MQTPRHAQPERCCSNKACSVGIELAFVGVAHLASRGKLHRALPTVVFYQEKLAILSHKPAHTQNLVRHLDIHSHVSHDVFKDSR